MSYIRIRKLSKNYYKLEKLLYLYEDILNKNIFYITSDKISKKPHHFRKIIRYLNIYNAIFKKSLKQLSKDDAFIVNEVYMKGKSACRVACENYISESTVYRTLKKFDLIFFCDIKKVSRIVNPLIEELKENFKNEQSRKLQQFR